MTPLVGFRVLTSGDLRAGSFGLLIGGIVGRNTKAYTKPIGFGGFRF